jgi:AraC-like DNA-binding protein
MAVRYREHSAPPGLSEWVECLWSGVSDEPVPARPVRPDGCLDIVYSRHDGLRAVGAMTRTHGNANLDWIAAQANLSPRQFRRRCLEESGLTPKHLCRVLRFRHSNSLASASRRPDWADIAGRAGYYDQAHLIRDFREFTGQTPMSVFSNTSSAVAG